MKLGNVKLLRSLFYFFLSLSLSLSLFYRSGRLCDIQQDDGERLNGRREKERAETSLIHLNTQ